MDEGRQGGLVAQEHSCQANAHAGEGLLQAFPSPRTGSRPCGVCVQATWWQVCTRRAGGRRARPPGTGRMRLTRRRPRACHGPGRLRLADQGRSTSPRPAGHCRWVSWLEGRAPDTCCDQGTHKIAHMCARTRTRDLQTSSSAEETNTMLWPQPSRITWLWLAGVGLSVGQKVRQPGGYDHVVLNMRWFTIIRLISGRILNAFGPWITR